MDAELMRIVGQIAGIGGLAIGALLIVCRDVIRRNIFPQMTKDQAYRLLRLIIVLVWSVAIVGIAAWVIAAKFPSVVTSVQPIPPTTSKSSITPSASSQSPTHISSDESRPTKSMPDSKPDNNSPPNAAGEQISIEPARLRADYETAVLHSVEVGGHTMPSPYFVRAFWDIMVINNSDRDISIVSYGIKPFSSDLPASGPYGESYAQGLFDFSTTKPLDLPLSIASGHALRVKACSFVVILPSSIPPDVSKEWKQGLPSEKIPMWDLFYGYFASHGIDFFGNKVSAGPGGINPDRTLGLKNQELVFHIRTGRGMIQNATLKWY